MIGELEKKIEHNEELVPVPPDGTLMEDECGCRIEVFPLGTFHAIQRFMCDTHWDAKYKIYDHIDGGKK
jgi:hypothetical protein